MVLNQDFKEFIQSLNENDVRYLIVGGYALAFHGHPRYTKDLDIWIFLNKENAKNLTTAINRFGFGSLELMPEDFLDPDKIIQFGYPPNRIDLIFDLKGVDFENCDSTKVMVEVDGIVMKFIDLENFKKNKKATGRLQDLADLEKLK